MTYTRVFVYLEYHPLPWPRVASAQALPLFDMRMLVGIFEIALSRILIQIGKLLERQYGRERRQRQYRVQKTSLAAGPMSYTISEGNSFILG